MTPRAGISAVLTRRPCGLPGGVWPIHRAKDTASGYTLLHSWTGTISCQIPPIPCIPSPQPSSPMPPWKWAINGVILPALPITDLWIIPETQCFDESEILCATVVWVTVNSLGLDGPFEKGQTYFVIDFSLEMNKTLPLEMEESHFVQSLSSRDKLSKKSKLKKNALLGLGLGFSPEGQLLLNVQLGKQLFSWRLRRAFEGTGSGSSWRGF